MCPRGGIPVSSLFIHIKFVLLQCIRSLLKYDQSGTAPDHVAVWKSYVLVRCYQDEAATGKLILRLRYPALIPTAGWMLISVSQHSAAFLCSATLIH